MGRGEREVATIMTAVNCWNGGHTEQARNLLADAGLTDLGESASLYEIGKELRRLSGRPVGEPGNRRSVVRSASLRPTVRWTPSGIGMIYCPGCDSSDIHSSEVKVESDGVRALYICERCSKGFAIALRRKGKVVYLVAEPEFPDVVHLAESPKKKPGPASVRLDPQRSFSDAQKKEIYLRCNGHCQICAEDLDSDWHADHVVPHSRGGRTEVINGQALCRSCNSRKRAKVLTVDGGE